MKNIRVNWKEKQGRWERRNYQFVYGATDQSFLLLFHAFKDKSQIITLMHKKENQL